MNTPRAKKQQQTKKGLSAKKGPVKGLRNVLAQPYEPQWPALNKDEGSGLEQLLTKLLPGLDIVHGIDGSVKHQHQHRREFLALGINVTTRDLEKDELCSVLLDSGVESQLIKHVIIMAQKKNIPILLVPFLKNVTENKWRFASAAMGFKREVSEPSHCLNEIYQEILKFSSKWTETVEFCKDAVANPTDEKAEVMVPKENSSKNNCAPATSPYIFRSSRKERTFVPPISKDESSKDNQESGDFIPIGTDPDSCPKFVGSRKKQRYMDMVIAEDKKTADQNEPPTKVKKKKNATYLPLKVKRIQGNNNRAKATKTAKTKKKSSLNKK